MAVLKLIPAIKFDNMRDNQCRFTFDVAELQNDLKLQRQPLHNLFSSTTITVFH